MESPHPTPADDPIARYFAHHLAHSMRVLAVAPADLRTRQDTNDLLHAGIMIDAFYVNFRLLAEFLLGRGDSADDIGMRTFGVDRWSPFKECKRRLEEHYNTASKFVTHYSKHRVSADDPTGPLPGFPVDPNRISTMAWDVLSAIDRFINQVPGDIEKRILRDAYDWAHQHLVSATSE